MKYTSRGLRRRRGTDKWEVILSHKDPATGRSVTTYHTIEAKSEKQAQKKRNDLILELERKGSSISTNMTVRDFMAHFMAMKEASATIEASTLRSYYSEARKIDRYLGDVKLCELSIPIVNQWMADMVNEGYAPKTAIKPFRLLKQALKYAVAAEVIARNPCDFCKPPKRAKTLINALDQEERTRMLRLAREAQPQLLGYIIEIALTTGLRRGEICALHASDLLDDKTLMVRRSLGNGQGGYYEKEPKTESSVRALPLSTRTWSGLNALKKDMLRTLAEFGAPNADPYLFGTWDVDSRPYNPTKLGKEFSAFCKMNGFSCTFHDLRHTFATMMIGRGNARFAHYIRTVADWLGHEKPSVTLDIYADVAPEAKRDSLVKMKACFDLDMDGIFGEPETDSHALPASGVRGLTFTVEQLELMLAEARRREKGVA